MKSKIGNDGARRRKQRQRRVRRKVELSNRTSLSVFRSSKHIYAQLVEPLTGRTITAVSTRTQGVVDGGVTGGVEAAKKVGAAIAVAAKEKGISQVVFDRNGFLFHGRVKALADAAREAGLEF